MRISYFPGCTLSTKARGFDMAARVSASALGIELGEVSQLTEEDLRELGLPMGPWLCDKGRFAHHYMEDPERLTTPLVRKGGKLVEATWDEAIATIAEQLKAAGDQVAAIGGGRLSNEDLFALQKLVRSRGSNDSQNHNDTSP